MAVLITGGGGFFGSALVRAFARNGEQVIVFDQTPKAQAQRRPDTPVERVRYLTGDVADRSTLEAGRFADVTAIVHAAALSLPNEVEMDRQVVDVNLGGTANLLHLATQLGECSRFLYVSSAGVYEQGGSVTLSEADANGGSSLYGATKIASEVLARRYGEMFGLDVGAVRPTSLWGPGEIVRPTRPFVTPLRRLIEYARDGQTVRIDHPNSKCDWTYVDDGAEMAYRFFAAKMGGRALTISSGRTIPFTDVVDAAMRVFGLRVDDSAAAVVDAGPDRPATFSNEAIVNAIGWSPPHTLVSGMQAYRAFLDANGADTDASPTEPKRH
jgi:nucleoside-diphosphate-sugar epimerase